MSFPDTEERAKECDKSAPMAAQRLRQYLSLCKAFEAQVAELQASNAALFAAVADLQKKNGDLVTERDQLKQAAEANTPTPPAEPSALDALAARVAALEEKVK